MAQTGSSFADIFARAAKGEIDGVVGMERTEAWRVMFDFVGPFSNSPTVSVMRSNHAGLWRSPSDVEGAPLALLGHYFLAPPPHPRRSGLVMAEFDIQDQVLSAVNDGQADAAIGNATFMSRLIDVHFAGRLGLTGGVADGDSALYFRVPTVKPELTRLLAKDFAAITP